MKMEILAPAGSEEALDAAVYSGADAVYLGAGAFNARRNAQNFAVSDLKRIAAYCHERDCRVHLTLNTLLFDDELPLCKNDIREICRAGIDAVIVQDLGVARLLKETAPELILHGSTQMSIHTLQGALLLKQLGFSRVVLSRELSREETAEIVSACGMETEVFVHGALCMSVSGQCRLSALIGSRSGNRGLCAQPCRLPFGAAGKNHYDLSLKDLSLIDKIPELQEMGVSSLKIEGRMKRPEYVAAAVTACRGALSGKRDKALLDDLRKVFSRNGFTSGYYDGKLGASMFGTRGKEDVTAAAEVLGRLKPLYKNECRRVPLTGCFSLKKGAPAAFSVRDNRGNQAAVSGEIPQTALQKETDPERAAAALLKTGGTPYYFESIETDIEKGVAFPASAINAMRREALEKLSQERGESKPIDFTDVPLSFKKPEIKAPPTLRARFFEYKQIPLEEAPSLERIFLPLEEAIRLSENELDAIRGKLTAELPGGMFGREQSIVQAVRTLKARGVSDFLAANLAQLKIAKDEQVTVRGGMGLNVVNSLAIRALKELDVKDAVLSYELLLKKARNIENSIPLGVVAYGYLPVMLTRNCPIKNTLSCRECKRSFTRLTDRTGSGFPVMCHGGCSEIYNSVPLYMADKLSELSGFSFLLLYFTLESREECRKVIHEYQRNGQMPQNATRGLYYRGVL